MSAMRALRRSFLSRLSITEIAIRTIDWIDSKTANTYREYAATLDDAVVVNGLTVLPAKTDAFFRVTDIVPSGFRRPAALSLSLVAVTVSGVRVSVETSRLRKEKRRDEIPLRRWRSAERWAR